MSLLVESIRLKNGIFNNLNYHLNRMDDARLSLSFKGSKINLKEILTKMVVPVDGLYKCRVVYDTQIQSIEYQPYTFKCIESLKLIEDDLIDYSFKYCERGSINKLFNQKEYCDDVLIIKKGLVTDTSYANIVFKLNNEWITPNTPLLKGTMRQYLLDRGMIREEEIHKKDIVNFKSFKLINAMIAFDTPEISIKNIVE